MRALLHRARHRRVGTRRARMYDAREVTMAEIAASCGGVTPMTIYRHIRTGQPTAR